MRLTDFQYDLPEHLIAQEALADRAASRMLVLDRVTGAVEHRQFVELPELLRGDETIIYNDTRVIPARMWARKASGGRVEVLALRLLSDRRFEAMTKSSKPLRIGQPLTLDKTGEVLDIVEVPQPGRVVVELAGAGPVLAVIHAEGSTPLPPYIRRAPHWDDSVDRQRYQTIFAEEEGSVAAPTAGLHFTPEIVEALEKRGCDLVPVTLHVGPGTFLPVRMDNVEEHRMETEYYTVPEDSARRINAALDARRPILAIGTTSVRCIESAGRSGRVEAGSGWTDLFIYPGYDFRVVGAMVTNFHLPGSSLIMLVSALATRNHVLAAYEMAARQEYRFYSYGDCMLVR